MRRNGGRFRLFHGGGSCQVLRPFLLLFLHLLFLPLPLRADAPVEIRIGVILPLTGPLAPTGSAMRQGIELACAEKGKPRFKVLFEDDQTNTKTVAVSAATKLINIDHVMVILNSETGTMNAIAPILERSKVPGLVLWDSNSKLTELGSFIFGFGYNTEGAGREMAQFASNTLHVERVAVVGANDEWSELLADSFVEELTHHLPVTKRPEIIRMTINGDEADFRSHILRFRQRKVDAVYLPLWGVALRSFIRQSRELRFGGDLLAADAFSIAEIEDLGKHAEGVFVTQAWFDDPSFAARLRARFGTTPSEVNLAYAAIGYDAVTLVRKAVELLKLNEQAVTPETLRNAMSRLTFQGVLGQTTVSQERLVDRRERILEVRDGKFSLPHRAARNRSRGQAHSGVL